MANLKLKRTVSGSKAKMIQSSDNCFILGVTQPGSEDENKFKIFDPSKGVFLGGIFPSEDFIVDNFIHNPDVDSDFDIDLGTRGPRGKYIVTSQLGDAVFSMKGETLSGISHSVDDVDSRFDFESNFIVLYDSFTDPSELDETYFNNLSAPRALLSGLPFAYLSDQPLELQFYNFETGTLFANSFNLKNMYDWNWDVSAKLEENLPDCSGFLERGRIYRNMGINNNIIWLSYNSTENLSGSRTACYGREVIVPIERFSSSSGDIFDYEFVERIKGFHRAQRDRLHKSNIFSIRIRNAGLNEAVTNEIEKKRLQQSIENVIRNIVKKVAPIHTELFKIEFKGE